MLRARSASTFDRPTRKKPSVTLTASPASGVPRACSLDFIRMPGTLPTPPPAKSGGRMKVSSAVWLAGSEVSVLRRNDIVILNLRSGISMSARTAISGFWPAGGLDRFGAPDHRADILLALGIGRILVIQHDALRHRRDLIGRRRLADAIGNLRLRQRRRIVLWRFHHGRRRLEQAAHGRHHRLAPQDRRADQDQHDADRDRALERKHRAGAGALLRLAVLRRARGRGAGCCGGGA